MKKAILGIIILVIIIGGYFVYQNNNQSQSQVKISEEYYQGLKDKCEISKFKLCCLDSVKTMEVVGGYKFGDFMTDGCKDGYEMMKLRCPGAYILCSPFDEFTDDRGNLPLVPSGELTINPGPGIDPDYPEAVICTEEAKSCGDGTYVGREGRNCEFAKCPGNKPTPDFAPTKNNPIQLPENVITEKDCAAQGGEVFNTLGETSYNGELIGKIEGLLCPCTCLVRGEGSDVIWVDVNGNIEEFTGNLDDIKTYNDCKNAGFAIKDDVPEICTAGEPHMTGGKYKTFYNNPIETGKTCTDYHYSTCPGSCVAKCKSSSCSEPDEHGAVSCTSDCDGVGSCVEK